MASEDHYEGWLVKKGSEARRWEGSTISERWFVSEGYRMSTILSRNHIIPTERPRVGDIVQIIEGAIGTRATLCEQEGWVTQCPLNC